MTGRSGNKRAGRTYFIPAARLRAFRGSHKPVLLALAGKAPLQILTVLMCLFVGLSQSYAVYMMG